MEHLYLINSNLTPLILSDLTLEKFRDQITQIKIPISKSDNLLTHDIHKHFQNINNLNLDQFEWKYYINKYPDLKLITLKKHAWEHWRNVGLKEYRNPIDGRTLQQPQDINKVITLLTILSDAKQHQYQKIVIVDLKNQIENLDILLQTHQNDISQHSIVILSQTHQASTYIIDISMYIYLLSELSYFIHTFDYILQFYDESHQNQTLVIDYPKNIISKSHQTTNKPNYKSLEINHVQLVKLIPTYRLEYFMTNYTQYCHQSQLQPLEIQCLNQMICKCPYDWIKLRGSQLISLDFSHYLKLCIMLIRRQLNTLQIINTPNLLNFNSLVFNHDFYLDIYPCYKNLFKTSNESYQHYINHGQNEKLIPNEIIFKLIRTMQDYQLDQLLRTNQLLKMSQLPTFYDSIGFRYYDDKIQPKPLIYILTRTCNREQLFTECCESINQQLLVNVRHIVGYDNELTKNYVKSFKHIYKTLDLTAYKGKLHPNQYLDLFYEQIVQSTPGWVMVLDDDDKFMTNQALSILESYLTNINNLVIWMLYRPDKFIYPIHKDKPLVGEIASCCYLYHTSKIVKGHWGGNAIGDFDFFQYLFSNITNHIYIDLPLTGVNYKDKVSGWTAL